MTTISETTKLGGAINVQEKSKQQRGRCLPKEDGDVIRAMLAGSKATCDRTADKE